MEISPLKLICYAWVAGTAALAFAHWLRPAMVSWWAVLLPTAFVALIAGLVIFFLVVMVGLSSNIDSVDGRD